MTKTLQTILLAIACVVSCILMVHVELMWAKVFWAFVVVLSAAFFLIELLD